MKRLWWLLAIPIIIALFYFSTLSGSQKTETPVRQPDIASERTVDELYSLANEERTKASVAPLKLDSRLNQSAQEKADDMAKNNYFDHVNPTTGIHGYSLVSKYAKECNLTAENITGGFTALNAVSKWVNSKAHYSTMTSKDYSITGFGITKAGQEYYFVQHFC